jgi:hypothetical protein
MKPGTRLRRVPRSILIFVVLLPMVSSCMPQNDKVVQLAVGSENVSFFQDSRVQAIFKHTYRYDVQVTGFGSRQMADVDIGRYDGFVPSSSVAAQQMVSAHPPLHGRYPPYPLFSSPLAIATYQPVAACLRRLGIAYQDSSGIWWFKVQAYLQAVQDVPQSQWSDCGGALASLHRVILLTTTNPQCSNSGEMFVADASYVANGGTVQSISAAVKIGRELAPMISGQGYMENTTDNLFQDYLSQGMDYSPMVLIYESEFVGEEITAPRKMAPGMMLMYPTPDIFSKRTLIARDPRGAAIGRILSNNPQLAKLAQQSYGFRDSTPQQFQQTMGRFRIFGRKITVPTQFAPASAPMPDILEKIIDVAENSASTC